MKNSRLALFSASVISILFAVSISVFAQEDGGFTIKTEVGFVPVDTVLLDRQGHAISGLKEGNFRISVRPENVPASTWEPQEIKYFEDYNWVRRTRVLIDASESMNHSSSLSREVAAEIVRILRNDEDDFSIWQFQNYVTRIADWTKDTAKIDAAISGVRVDGGTAIYKALFTDISTRKYDLAKYGPAKDITILITDGYNNLAEPLVNVKTGEMCDSRESEIDGLCREGNKEDLIANFNRNRALLYVVDLSEMSEGPSEQNDLMVKNQAEWDYVARSTGGVRFSVHGAARASEVARKISEMTGPRYFMGFDPRKVIKKGNARYEILVEIGETKDGGFMPREHNDITLVHRTSFQAK